MSTPVVSVTPTQIRLALEALVTKRLRDCMPASANGLGHDFGEVVRRANLFGLDLTERRLRDRLARNSVDLALGVALVEVLKAMKAAGRPVCIPQLNVTLEEAIEFAKAQKLHARAERTAAVSAKSGSGQAAKKVAKKMGGTKQGPAGSGKGVKQGPAAGRKSSAALQPTAETASKKVVRKPAR